MAKKRARDDAPPGLLVRKTQCATCIYRPDSPLDIEHLESQVRDRWGGFKGFRACHHHEGTTVCCHGFWSRHAGEFPGGQLAVRTNLVFTIDGGGAVEHLPQPAETIRCNLYAERETGETQRGGNAPRAETA